MATYTIVPRTMPSRERSARITAVAAGDQVDLVEILGRSARGIKLVTANTTDVITYRLNSLLHLEKFNESEPPTDIEVWSASARYNTFSATGDTEHYSDEGLRISSIEIVTTTAATIEIVIW